MTHLIRRLFTVLALLGFLEVGARLSGVVDFPLHRGDAAYGYAPRESQSGEFLHQFSWVYNDVGMGVAAPYRPGGTLLIGDSIVNGGNRIDQPGRLGPRLQSELGSPVWPISAGRWSLANQMAWLSAHPQIRDSADRIVWVLNPTDFAEQSHWREGDSLLPDRYPVSVLAFLFDRLLLVPRRPQTPVTGPGHDWIAELKAFRRAHPRPMLIVLYPVQDEPTEAPDTIRRRLGGDVLSLADAPRWREATYRDPVHVDAAGTRLMAQIIAERVLRNDDH